MASHGVLDSIASNEVHRSRGRGYTRSPSQARAQSRTVDRLSGHRAVKLLSRFGDRGQHVEASVSSAHDRTGKNSGDRGIMAHDDRTIAVVNPSSPNPTAHDYCAEILYKYRCSSFVFQLLINREAIKKF